MTQFIAFTKKEFFESHATFRMYILFTVFAILGIMGPMMALLMPVIFEMAAAEMAAMGITIEAFEPTYIDSWTQFFENFALMGTIALVVIFSGTMANELSRGTLISLLTKGLKRHTVILAKFFTISVLWTASVLLAVGIAYVYTAIYFDTQPIAHFALVFGAPWLFGLFIISLLFFGGTLFGNFYGALAVSMGTFFALSLINMVPNVSRFNPASLSAGTLTIIMGTGESADFIPAMIICGACVVVIIAGTIAVFNKKTV